MLAVEPGHETARAADVEVLEPAHVAEMVFEDGDDLVGLQGARLEVRHLVGILRREIELILGWGHGSDSRRAAQICATSSALSFGCSGKVTTRRAYSSVSGKEMPADSFR